MRFTSLGGTETDASRLDTLLWSLIKLDENYKRLSHSATQVGSYLFIFGGHDGSSYMSDLLLFNLGESPSPFHCLSALTLTSLRL